jgi:hypothetical protein
MTLIFYVAVYNCLPILQIVVTSFVLAPNVALKRYLDPLNCSKYYIAYSRSYIIHLNCPNNLVFNPDYELCDTPSNYPCGVNDPPSLPQLIAGYCSGKIGYYCNSPSSFTYCIRGNITIVENKSCNMGSTCGTSPFINNPCYPYKPV